jgi:hypothetical protein
MKKYFLIVCLILFSVLLPESASAEFRNDPNGFGSMYWGESLSQVQPDMHARFYKYGVNGDPIYLVLINNANGELYLNGRMVAVTAFHNNRLIAIMIPLLRKPGYETDHAYQELYSHLRQLCGVPDKVETSAVVWSGSYTVLILTKTGQGVAVCLMSARAAHQEAVNGRL